MASIISICSELNGVAKGFENGMSLMCRYETLEMPKY